MTSWKEEVVTKTIRRWRLAYPFDRKMLGIIESQAARAYWDSKGVRRSHSPGAFEGLPDDALTYRGNGEELIIEIEYETKEQAVVPHQRPGSRGSGRPGPEQ